MVLKQFDLAALATLDGGRIREAVNQAIQAAETDCRDRPGLPGARKVTLTLSIVPVSTASGDLDSVNVECEIKTQSPARKSKTYNMNATTDGLVYQELAPEDADQMTFDLPEKEEKADA